MTIKELRAEISKSNFSEELNNFEVVFELPYERTSESLVGLLKIYEYFKRQLEAWNSLEELPTYLLKSREFCIETISLLFKVIERNTHNRVNDSLINLKVHIENTSVKLSYNKTHYIFSANSAETLFIFNLAINYPNAVDAAVKFLVNEKLELPTDIKNENFIGYLKAYEFRIPDEKRLKRSEAERASLSRIKSEYNHFLSEAKINHEFLFEGSQDSRDKEFGKWFADLRAGFNEFDGKSIQRVKDLEELYNKKLKLEAPASYWQKRAKTLHDEGNKWLTWFIVCITVAIVKLLTVLYFLTNTKLEELFSSAGSAIRWSIVLITFVSLLVYGIKIFAKLMFSSYHLARDAEEREQLAYFYLSLEKDSTIDKEERNLIMQSLFSRADSGLLKEDSSVQMPGNMMDKFSGR